MEHIAIKHTLSEAVADPIRNRLDTIKDDIENKISGGKPTIDGKRQKSALVTKILLSYIFMEKEFEKESDTATKFFEVTKNYIHEKIQNYKSTANIEGVTEEMLLYYIMYGTVPPSTELSTQCMNDVFDFLVKRLKEFVQFKINLFEKQRWVNDIPDIELYFNVLMSELAREVKRINEKLEAIEIYNVLGFDFVSKFALKAPIKAEKELALFNAIFSTFGKIDYDDSTFDVNEYYIKNKSQLEMKDVKTVKEEDITLLKAYLLFSVVPWPEDYENSGWRFGLFVRKPIDISLNNRIFNVIGIDINKDQFNKEKRELYIKSVIVNAHTDTLSIAKCFNKFEPFSREYKTNMQLLSDAKVPDREYVFGFLASILEVLISNKDEIVFIYFKHLSQYNPSREITAQPVTTEKNSLKTLFVNMLRTMIFFVFNTSITTGNASGLSSFLNKITDDVYSLFFDFTGAMKEAMNKGVTTENFSKVFLLSEYDVFSKPDFSIDAQKYLRQLLKINVPFSKEYQKNISKEWKSLKHIEKGEIIESLHDLFFDFMVFVYGSEKRNALFSNNTSDVSKEEQEKPIFKFYESIVNYVLRTMGFTGTLLKNYSLSVTSTIIKNHDHAVGAAVTKAVDTSYEDALKILGIYSKNFYKVVENNNPFKKTMKGNLINVAQEHRKKEVAKTYFSQSLPFTLRKQDIMYHIVYWIKECATLDHLHVQAVLMADPTEMELMASRLFSPTDIHKTRAAIVGIYLFLLTLIYPLQVEFNVDAFNGNLELLHHHLSEVCAPILLFLYFKKKYPHLLKNGQTISQWLLYIESSIDAKRFNKKTHDFIFDLNLISSSNSVPLPIPRLITQDVLADANVWAKRIHSLDNNGLDKLEEITNNVAADPVLLESIISFSKKWKYDILSIMFFIESNFTKEFSKDVTLMKISLLLFLTFYFKHNFYGSLEDILIDFADQNIIINPEEFNRKTAELIAQREKINSKREFLSTRLLKILDKKSLKSIVSYEAIQESNSVEIKLTDNEAKNTLEKLLSYNDVCTSLIFADASSKVDTKELASEQIELIRKYVRDHDFSNLKLDVVNTEKDEAEMNDSLQNKTELEETYESRYSANIGTINNLVNELSKKNFDADSLRNSIFVCLESTAFDIKTILRDYQRFTPNMLMELCNRSEYIFSLDTDMILTRTRTTNTKKRIEQMEIVSNLHLYNMVQWCNKIKQLGNSDASIADKLAEGFLEDVNILDITELMYSEVYLFFGDSRVKEIEDEIKRKDSSFSIVKGNESMQLEGEKSLLKEKLVNMYYLFHFMLLAKEKDADLEQIEKQYNEKTKLEFVEERELWLEKIPKVSKK